MLFCKRSLVFLGFLGCVLFLSYSANHFLFKHSAKFIHEDVTVLATGSSLISNSLNPKCVPGLINVACAAEPLSVSYYKVREICGFHPALQTVVVSFSLPEISERKDFFFDGKDPITTELLERLSYLQNGYDLNHLNQFELDYFRYWESFIRNRVFPNYHYWSKFMKIRNDNCLAPHIGGFIPQGNGFLVDELIDYSRWLRRFFPVRNSECLISKIDNPFLDSIAAYCSDQDLKLVVVAMPVRQALYRQIPSGYIAYHDSVLKKVQENDFVTVVNASNYLSNEYFVDHAHVNGYGAKKMSRLLASVLDSINSPASP